MVLVDMVKNWVCCNTVFAWKRPLLRDELLYIKTLIELHVLIESLFLWWFPRLKLGCGFGTQVNLIKKLFVLNCPGQWTKCNGCSPNQWHGGKLCNNSSVSAAKITSIIFLHLQFAFVTSYPLSSCRCITLSDHKFLISVFQNQIGGFAYRSHNKPPLYVNQLNPMLKQIEDKDTYQRIVYANWFEGKFMLVLFSVLINWNTKSWCL